MKKPLHISLSEALGWRHYTRIFYLTDYCVYGPISSHILQRIYDLP